MLETIPERSPSPLWDLSEEQRHAFLADIWADSVQCVDNPAQIDKPYWKFIIAHGDLNAWDSRKKLGFPVRSQNNAWVREPVFCFQRFGSTETRLPDGRIVYVAGEHEDGYDPDFYIYNDVVVVHGRGRVAEQADSDADSVYYPDSDMEQDPDYAEHVREMRAYRKREKLQNAASATGASPEDIEIYGYPTDVFPPTDFHTSTYIKDESSGREHIYIIGGLGGGDSPHRTATLTHRLDLQDYSIQRIETSGEAPPVLDSTNERRNAELDGDRIVVVDGADMYTLSLADTRWSRIR
ncbi:hypothetical protein C8A03DRAFT_38144 [Achaetomium macrosporum]|uniref:Uncharacterized protein n=1 Tax=Achaetomium macrosporum TaxID=79813 RepID=A0AAN7C304_9PEZI|nr:hypothetical protein C8A03DRAFT_38144 [Achaetomium macrosporum]